MAEATAPPAQPPTAPPTAPPKAAAAPQTDSMLIARLTSQVKKLTESNAKYKSLLKLAKERIQQQEEELGELTTALESATTTQINSSTTASAAAAASLDEQATAAADNNNESTFIVRVCQRVKVSSNNKEEIWALMELEQSTAGADVDPMFDVPVRRFKEWQRFDTESQLQDAIRRDTGEPLQLPPYSLTAEQSSKLQKQAKQEMAALQEEFRRFRVKAELNRKQAEAHIRDLSSSSKQSAAQRIEGGNNNQQNSGTSSSETTSFNRNGGDSTKQGAAKSNNNNNNNHPNHSSNGGPASNGSQQQQHQRLEGQVEQLRAELVSQEAYWKEAYDTLLAENTALKSSGSEALLASQWRQRYEQSRQELTDLQSSLKQQKAEDSLLIYESKYRDLKESFRLYRKKAKEIFETTTHAADPNFLSSLQDGSADAKLSYLRNLLVNYFTADETVKPHMEGAIGTLLQFSQEDVERIEKKRAEEESWLF